MMLASAGMMANAQQEQTQLPNGNFDGTWVDCKPDGSNVVGTQPGGWMASSVYKMGIKGELVFPDNNREQSGDNAFSVRLENRWVGIEILKMGANAPGYITLGTSWAYGDIANVGKPNDTSDGGSYGGIQFEYRPDALSLWVKRTHGTEKPTEKASVIFYSWKGQTSSEVITGLSSNPVKINMVDREKDVLGMIQDGVTKTDFELISTSENYIEGNITEWTQFTYPITYVSDGTPEKINVILSSSDYFDRSQLGKDNKFWVDDVKFIYYSRLASITLNGEAITLEEGKYDYPVDKVLDFSEEDIAYTLEGESKSANVSVSVDAESAAVTVVVSNVGADTDGVSSHTYTFQYQKPEVEPVVEEYTGYLNVEMLGSTIAENTSSKIEIQDYQNGYCTFLLPNLIITIEDSTLPLGDIRIDNVEITPIDGGNSYIGTVEDMALMGGAIHAKVVLNGTIIGSEVKMDVDVIWYQDYPANTIEIPINVSFTSAPLSGVESVAGDGVKVYAAAGCVVVEGAEGVAQVYTADGKQVAAEAVNGKAEIALANGLYIVRVGNKVQKVVVK